MTKRNLSIIQLLISVVSVILLYIDGMFVWCSSDMRYASNDKRVPLSFNNIFGTQFELGFFTVLLIAFIVLCAILSTIIIFKHVDKLDNKYMVIIPAITLILFIILGIYAGSYTDTVESKYLATRYLSVSLGLTFYIEALLLAANTFIECAKQFIQMPYNK